MKSPIYVIVLLLALQSSVNAKEPAIVAAYRISEHDVWPDGAPNYEALIRYLKANVSPEPWDPKHQIVQSKSDLLVLASEKVHQGIRSAIAELPNNLRYIDPSQTIQFSGGLVQTGEMIKHSGAKPFADWFIALQATQFDLSDDIETSTLHSTLGTLTKRLGRKRRIHVRLVYTANEDKATRNKLAVGIKRHLADLDLYVVAIETHVLPKKQSFADYRATLRSPPREITNEGK